MSLPLIGFSFTFHRVRSERDVVGPFVSSFLPDLLDPKSIQFSSLSDDGCDFLMLPGSLPPSPFDPDLFESEYCPSGLTLSKLGSPEPHMRFSDRQNEFVDGWGSWTAKHQGKRGEVSLQCWGLVQLTVVRSQRVERDWFLMEELRVQKDTIRVPILEVDLKFGSNGDSTMFLYTHALIWTSYACIAEPKDTDDDGYVPRTAHELEIARTNSRALATAVRRLIDAMPCSSWEWLNETESCRPDLSRILRGELANILERRPV